MPTVLLVHRTCVLLSVGGFVARFALREMGSPLMRTGFVRTAPHFVDTVLLGSALTLCVLTGQWPIAQPWLTAKVAGLVCYIGFGAFALSPVRPSAARRVAFLGAIACVGFILHAALTRQPW